MTHVCRTGTDVLADAIVRQTGQWLVSELGEVGGASSCEGLTFASDEHVL